MKITNANRLDDILRDNIHEDGEYNVILDVPTCYLCNKYSLICAYFDIRTTLPRKDCIIATFKINNKSIEYSSVHQQFNSPKNTTKIKNIILGLILAELVIIEKKKATAKRYYFFDENFALNVDMDTDREIDKKRKEEHNYFLADEYSPEYLRKKINEHVKNMRLNLLSYFYPGIEE